MPVTRKYTATSLEDVAAEFERRAKECHAMSTAAGTSRYEVDKRLAEQRTWLAAADILRHTVLAPPPISQVRVTQVTGFGPPQPPTFITTKKEN